MADQINGVKDSDVGTQDIKQNDQQSNQGCIPGLLQSARQFLVSTYNRLTDKDNPYGPSDGDSCQHTTASQAEKQVDARSYNLRVIFPHPLDYLETEEGEESKKLHDLLLETDAHTSTLGIKIPYPKFNLPSIKPDLDEIRALQEEAEKSGKTTLLLLHEKLERLSGEIFAGQLRSEKSRFRALAENPSIANINSLQAETLSKQLLSIVKRIEIGFTLGLLNPQMIQTVWHKLDQVAEEALTQADKTAQQQEGIPSHFKVAYLFSTILKDLKPVDNFINHARNYAFYNGYYAGDDTFKGGNKNSGLNRARTGAKQSVINLRNNFAEGSRLPDDSEAWLEEEYKDIRFLASQAEDKRSINIETLTALLCVDPERYCLLKGGLLLLYQGINKTNLHEKRDNDVLKEKCNQLQDINPLKRKVEQALLSTNEGSAEMAFRIAMAIFLRTDISGQDISFYLNIDRNLDIATSLKEFDHIQTANITLLCANEIAALSRLCQPDEVLALRSLLVFTVKELVSHINTERKESFLLMINFLRHSVRRLINKKFEGKTVSKTTSEVEAGEVEIGEVEAGEVEIGDNFSENIQRIQSYAYRILAGSPYTPVYQLGTREAANRLTSEPFTPDINIFEVYELEGIEKRIGLKVGDDFLAVLGNSFGIDREFLFSVLRQIKTIEDTETAAEIISSEMRLLTSARALSKETHASLFLCREALIKCDEDPKRAKEYIQKKEFTEEEVSESSPQDTLTKYFRNILRKSPILRRERGIIAQAVYITERYHPNVASSLGNGAKLYNIETTESFATAKVGEIVDALMAFAEAAVIRRILNEVEFTAFTEADEKIRRETLVTDYVKALLAEYESEIRASAYKALVADSIDVKTRIDNGEYTLTEMGRRMHESLEDFKKFMSSILNFLAPTKK